MGKCVFVEEGGTLEKKLKKNLYLRVLLDRWPQTFGVAAPNFFQNFSYVSALVDKGPKTLHNCF